MQIIQMLWNICCFNIMKRPENFYTMTTGKCFFVKNFILMGSTVILTVLIRNVELPTRYLKKIEKEKISKVTITSSVLIRRMRKKMISLVKRRNSYVWNMPKKTFPAIRP